jgi:surface carbohydrate biosynthesis protein
MKKPFLIIPIETKVRELNAKFLLACIAAEKGFSVIIGGSTRLRNLIPWLPRDAFFLDKSVAPSRNLHFRNYRNLGMRIVAWCEEGLVFSNPAEYLRRKVDRDAFRQVEFFFAWGAYQAGLIRSHVPDAASRVLEAGNPRIDLLSPNVRAIFHPESDRLKCSYPKLILVNTNFSLCNHKKGDGAFLAGLKAADKVRTPEEEAFVQEWIDHKKVLFDAFRKVLPVLSRSFPDTPIVVRPHPSENHDTWRMMAADLPNVRVIHDGSAIPWLQAASVIVHNGCTTGLEGHLLGRPVIAYQPAVSETYDLYLPNQVSVSSHTPEELVGAIRRFHDTAFENDNHPHALAPVVESFIHHADGGAADFIAERLWDIATAKRIQPAHARFQQLVRRWIWRVLTYRKRKANPTAYELQKFPGLALDELQDLLNAFANVMGRFGALNVKVKWPGCFVLETESRVRDDASMKGAR